MIDFGVKLIGFSAVTKAIKDLVDENKIDAITRAAALAVEAEAKRLCPVRTGRLRASITTEKIDTAAYAVGTNVEYAPYVEFGTRKMRAKPYLRPAAERVAKGLGRGLHFKMGGL